MKLLFQRLDAMIDRVVEAENFFSNRRRLQPIRLKAILENLRGYVTLAAVFFSAHAVMKANNGLGVGSIALYLIFLVAGFFLMVQSCYLMLTGVARLLLSLLPPRKAAAFTKQVRSSGIRPKLVVYAGVFILLILYWMLLESLLTTLAKAVFQL